VKTSTRSRFSIKGIIYFFTLTHEYNLMNFQSIKQAREQLLTIFSKGLTAVNGHHCVAEYLSQNSLPTEKVWVVAIGKAASSMMLGALEYLDSVQSESRLTAGLVITKQGHGGSFSDKRITVIESDHPVATQRSLDAGQRLVEYVSLIPETDTLLFLISGGTSALVEVLPENTSPNKTKAEQLSELNHLLLSNPWPIDEINRVRQSVSCIKNGKLLGAIKTPHCVQLTISDVPNNDLSIIGSGLLVKGTTQHSKSAIALPDWVKRMQANCSPSACLVSLETSPVEHQVEHGIVADNTLARKAIAQFVSSTGLELLVNEAIDGEVTAASKTIATTLNEGRAGVYLWGGETVIDLPEYPGLGGRCQSLALHVAEQINQREDVVLLAIGTDGTDGPGDAAGAVIDGLTIQRGLQSGFDSHKELLNANAGHYLEETGDLIDTGPTGTNVMDLIIGIKLDTH